MIKLLENDNGLGKPVIEWKGRRKISRERTRIRGVKLDRYDNHISCLSNLIQIGDYLFEFFTDEDENGFFNLTVSYICKEDYDDGLSDYDTMFTTPYNEDISERDLCAIAEKIVDSIYSKFLSEGIIDEIAKGEDHIINHPYPDSDREWIPEYSKEYEKRLKTESKIIRTILKQNGLEDYDMI